MQQVFRSFFQIDCESRNIRIRFSVAHMLRTSKKPNVNEATTSQVLKYFVSFSFFVFLGKR